MSTDLGVDLICRRRRRSTRSATRCSGAGAERVGEQAAEIVRVESGRPRFGREMTTATIPEEAGINERAVSFSKGCYIGQETVARLHYKGKPNRRLRGLRLSAPGLRRRADPGSASASSARSGPRSSPPPTGRSRSRSSVARPRTGATVAGRRRGRGRGRRAAVLSAACPVPRLRLGLPRSCACEEARRAGRRRWSPGSASSACGDDDFANDPRPASPVSVAAVITDTEVSVSPRATGAIGAGLATFTIANQSSEPGALVLEGPTDAASEEILPGDTRPAQDRAARGRVHRLGGRGLDGRR